MKYAPEVAIDEETLLYRLGQVAQLYDDIYDAVDYSFSMKKYRLLDKGDNRFLLFVRFMGIRSMFGANFFKFSFTLDTIDNERTLVKGRIRLKQFPVLFLFCYVGVSIYGIYDGYTTHNPTQAYNLLLAFPLLIAMFAVDYFFFKKAINKFFLFLYQNVMPG